MLTLDAPAFAAPVRRSSARRRRVVFVVAGVIAAALIAGAIAIAVAGAFSAAVAPFTTLEPFSPTAEDGLIAEGETVTLDDEVAAIARLNPELRDAMRAAEADAANDGLSFRVMSGWRSVEYQEWLLEDAIELYASEEVARQYVASPDRSTHVTGDGIDIGPIDAQFWLMTNGSRYGICQTYANERWHYELATDPGGVCPEMKSDAAS
ncbi:M15 family metallopeptidase [Microbacterium sp. A1-JK]|uniref:M15 family metallopeptidase n=1 Tax=Microbacterium sp. A1-JK TaxID=3177516 RepID=UPI003884A7E8